MNISKCETIIQMTAKLIQLSKKICSISQSANSQTSGNFFLERTLLSWILAFALLKTKPFWACLFAVFQRALFRRFPDSPLSSPCSPRLTILAEVSVAAPLRAWKLSLLLVFTVIHSSLIFIVAHCPRLLFVASSRWGLMLLVAPRPSSMVTAHRITHIVRLLFDRASDTPLVLPVACFCCS
jgi:hypothetical protein